MGYSHYLSNANTLGENSIKDWIYATNKIIAKYNETALPESKVVTCGKNAWTENDDKVFANGLGDNGHETLYIAGYGRMGDFEFCKTARKPYDAVVVASYGYVSAVHGLGFSSDGSSNSEYDEMDKGFDLLQRTFPGIDLSELKESLKRD